MITLTRRFTSHRIGLHHSASPGTALPCRAALRPALQRITTQRLKPPAPAYSAAQRSATYGFASHRPALPRVVPRGCAALHFAAQCNATIEAARPP